MPKREKPLFWKIGATWPAQKTNPDHWMSWALVHQQWKLVANRDLTHLGLYDISSDVTETHDLKKKNEPTAAALLTKLRKWQATLPAKPTGEVSSNLRKK